MSDNADNVAGSPAWMTTFADLMALMMTFFVLMYSMSTIDEMKYRTIAASLAAGFGASVKAPKSRTASTFNPGSIMPTMNPMSSRNVQPQQQTQTAAETVNSEVTKQVEQSLEKEIAEGIISVETTGNTVVVRFPEEIAFPSGSDQVSDAIIPILQRLSKSLEDVPGTIMVSGHTDNKAVAASDADSNWNLSTDRAVSVIHLLESISTIDPARIAATGYADTRPIASNDTPEGRSKNRRVEIAIVQQEP